MRVNVLGFALGALLRGLADFLSGSLGLRRGATELDASWLVEG